MDMQIDYSYVFEQALVRIKAERNAANLRPENKDLGWDVVKQHDLFDFADYGFSKYENILHTARNVSVSCINALFVQLMKQYNRPVKMIKDLPKDKFTDGVSMALYDIKGCTLLLFKNIEESPLWKIADAEPECISLLMQKIGALSCKYVYYMLDYAYLQIVGHNQDEKDPGRGYNFFSISWLWKEYFGENEQSGFLNALQKYISDVKNYIGYFLMKSLTPNALLNFRKIVDNKLRVFPYSQLTAKHIYRDINGQPKEYILPELDFLCLQNQFINGRTYFLLLESHDFAESLITAEWLYDSMKKAQAIDLTVIGMGYFKAVEQLMWELICLHKNEGKSIKGKLTKSKELNDENIKAEMIDNTLGAMASFYRDYLGILRNDLSWAAKYYIRESLFDYSRLRNGYFHKDNIHDWDVIETIRSSSICIFFLLLGSQVLSNQELETLGFLNTEEASDFYKLCEYVNYHSNELIFVANEAGNENFYISCIDSLATTDSEGHTNYTGVYLKALADKQHIIRITRENIPSKIWLGKFVFANTEKIQIEPIKVKKIFENGIFVGPNIGQEGQFEY